MWATDAMGNNTWPKPQMLAGTITDVTTMVHFEIENIKREKRTNAELANKLNDVAMVVQQQLAITIITNLRKDPRTANRLAVQTNAAQMET